ncbi:MAG: hypothetical protein CO042_00985 [Parcubacteria group bacterium CG_4_9_14_0_2_um_filter_41_8]|nr:MAG: hypothetical protein COW93_03515 [Parcubacteria group bacterium CG22_combo_CG10-13_8_21_14_all_41_9]PIQ79172.1 MAG: hypothetical protein COV79_04115 [Parcubacteria group bacterium CG11_big_fil_rev_8_21_14_0_20_41_14]PIR57323.1 MAG: hypothetical protein COU72_01575 [Parcubacteria group bacterium CG10_big_fil_rev_8_21_14_0_10_41_35]PIZ81484.1 MAG: hypothetical protein COY02_01775 [Parcubacteria group bacterium CG_4_10_14_0_2_um_filter_41_6]PJC40954.1 MAG: hypothetical protein CO042_00985 
MKVLMISTDSKILQKGSAVFERMKEYAGLVEQLDIVVCSVGNFEAVQITGNARAYSTNSTSKLWYIWDVLRMVKRAGIKDIDLVTAQDPFETGIAGWLVARRLKAKLQLQVHTDFMSEYFRAESLKNIIRVLIAKCLLPKADGIRVVSERIKRSMSKLKIQACPEYARGMSKIVILPIFVDVHAIQSAPVSVDLHKKYPQFDFIILMASRLEKEKNIELAIDAMRDVVKNNPKTGLVIAGAGSQEKELRQKVDQLGIKDNIIFEGWVDDLASYYKTCDVYLLCSNYEGYGMSLIMAASCGCAIITTDVGVVGGVVNKDNALVVGVGDTREIAEAIEKLHSDEAFRDALGQRACATVGQIDSKEEYFKKYKKSWEL